MHQRSLERARPAPAQRDTPRHSGRSPSLQDALGNRGATQLLRVHSKRGSSAQREPNDEQALEREADRVAEQLTPATGPLAHPREQSGEFALPPRARAHFERGLASDLSAVRVRTDASAAQDASSLHAAAVTRGPTIHFAAGRYRPDTRDGQRILAHELVHTVQQRQTSTSGPVLGRTHRHPQRSPDEQTLLYANMAEPLERYAVLRTALSPDDWTALNEGARHRQEQALRKTSYSPPAGVRTIYSVELPVSLLFEPSSVPTIQDWRGVVLGLIRTAATQGSSANQLQIALTLEAELFHRWRAANTELLDQSVRVMLIDPSGESGGPPRLTFQVGDQPVQTDDGALWAAELDKVGSNSLPEMTATVQTELAELQAAGQAIARADLTMAAVRRVIATSHEELAQSVIPEAQVELDGQISALQGIGGYAATQAAQIRGQVEALRDGELARYATADAEWRVQNPRPETKHEKHRKTIAELDRMDSENTAPLAFLIRGRAQLDSNLAHGIENSLRGNQFDLEQDAAGLYDRGQVSMRSFLSYRDAIQTRGDIMLGVFGALTLLSFCVGGFLAPVGSGLLRTALVYGALEGVAAMSPLIASNIYTSAHDLQDPLTQQMWKRNMYTPGQIALAGAVGFGVGAGFGAAGWLMANPARARGLVLAVERGVELPPVEGVVVERVGNGVVKVSVPGQSGHLELTPQGWRAVEPAGEAGVLRTTHGGAWDDVERVVGLHNQPLEMMGGEHGYLVYSPNSRQPLNYGMWLDELAGDAATSPLLLPSGRPSAAPDILELLRGGAGRAPAPWQGSADPLELLLPPPSGSSLVPYDPALIHGTPSFFQFRTPPGFQHAGPLAHVSPQTLPPIGRPGAPARWHYNPDTGWEPQFLLPGQGRGTQVFNWSAAGRDLVVVDVPGVSRTAIVNPARAGDPDIVRAYPPGMDPVDMTDPLTGQVGARSHLVPLRDGSFASTRADVNYVDHLSHDYNSRIRMTLEGRFRRAGQRWFAYNVLSSTPRYSSGGHPVPDAEIIVAITPQGPVGWRFPNDPSLYSGLPKNTNQALAPFELSADEVRRILAASGSRAGP